MRRSSGAGGTDRASGTRPGVRSSARGDASDRASGRRPALRRSSRTGATDRAAGRGSRPATVRRSASPDAILAAQRWESLLPHLLRAGADPDLALDRLRRYTRMLLEWNRGASNLISRNDESRIVERHIAESIEPAHWLRESGARRWIDLGSGAGLPAIPMVIAAVGSSWTLVESRRNKGLFLRKVINDLQLENVRVEIERLENLTGQSEYQNAYDGFTSRAVMTLGPTLKLAREFVAPGGQAFLWKGSRREDELREDPGWKGSWQLDGLLGVGNGLSVVMRFSRSENEM